jgi:hypothetical protein
MEGKTGKGRQAGLKEDVYRQAGKGGQADRYD